ncbi:peptidase M50 [Campylobacter majalis]|uniref:peptidase M50 n=1 Tax=Campylobacter majalis TaxID=2790656 RepID=UPI003D688E73
MLLNTFAPPFRLVGGYFIAGMICLILSVLAFLKADFSSLTALNTAGFMHVFFVGFAMSIIIGALYQLTSVILEKPFFSIKGAFLNLFAFVAGVLLLSYGMITSTMPLLHAGGGLLFVSLLFFDITFLLSFLKTKKRSFASVTLLISSIYLLAGIVIGFLLVMIFSGLVAIDFTTALYYHIYFVLGFVFFIIVGVASVLLPMFALAHNISFMLSKISLVLFVVAGFLLYFSEILAIIFIGLALFCFISQAFLIMKNRVRKAYDYWNLNVLLSLVSLALFIILFYINQTDIASFILIYGFLYPFIVGHLYKIAPFLIWYHYVSPYVGKAKVPLLDEMMLKRPAYISLAFNILALITYIINAKISMIFMLISIILVAVNVINFFKYTKFGVTNER